MALTVSVHLRHKSRTNARVIAIAKGLERAGCTLVERGRHAPVARGAELVLQSGMYGTRALRTAIDTGIPYMIAECPAYRHVNDITPDNWVSYGYGGLMGGAFHAPAPKEPRWAPDLKPLKTDGPTIIFGQKLNDHSLRGQDHNQWLQEKLIEFPDAEFRAHPLMTSLHATQEPLTDVLRRCYRAITFSSTAGTEALIEGCVSEPEHWGSSAYKVKDRRKWIHELSWQNFPFDVAATKQVGEHILSGYEVARVRAQEGQQEVPRNKATLDSWQYNIDDPRVLEVR